MQRLRIKGRLQTARFASRCNDCSTAIEEGDTFVWNSSLREGYCLQCGQTVRPRKGRSTV